MRAAASEIAGVVDAMEGLTVRTVGDGEEDRDHEDERENNPGHPGESNEGGEDPAWLVDPAPRKVFPFAALNK
jgi:hypothetical protein